MSAEITLEQIKGLKADYLRHLNLSEVDALIFNCFGVEGKQAHELYQTACLTQEHLLAGVGALASLLHDIITEPHQQNNHSLERAKTVLLMLPEIVGLIKGINGTISYLTYEAKVFELKHTSKV